VAVAVLGDYQVVLAGRLVTVVAVQVAHRQETEQPTLVAAVAATRLEQLVVQAAKV
jgi:hypothetical protein